MAGAIEAAGGLRYNPLLALPEAVRGPARPEDTKLEVLTGRRPLVESALADAARAQPGITVRRGVAVAGLLTGPPASSGRPAHLRGPHRVGRAASAPTWWST